MSQAPYFLLAQQQMKSDNEQQYVTWSTTIALDQIDIPNIHPSDRDDVIGQTITITQWSWNTTANTMSNVNLMSIIYMLQTMGHQNMHED
jgi:hypothetical protein